MRASTLGLGILLSCNVLSSVAGAVQAPGTTPPAWFTPPAELVGCKAVTPPDTSDLVSRYSCDGDTWVDIFIYTPAKMGLVATDSETTVEAEFRMYADTARTLVDQGVYDSLAFDDLRPQCYPVPGGQVDGGLLQGTGIVRGQVRFTTMAVFAVKGYHLKIRASGGRAWMFDPQRFSQALLRDAIKWD